MLWELKETNTIVPNGECSIETNSCERQDFKIVIPNNKNRYKLKFNSINGLNKVEICDKNGNLVFQSSRFTNNETYFINLISNSNYDLHIYHNLKERATFQLIPEKIIYMNAFANNGKLLNGEIKTDLDLRDNVKNLNAFKNDYYIDFNINDQLIEQNIKKNFWRNPINCKYLYFAGHGLPNLVCWNSKENLKCNEFLDYNMDNNKVSLWNACFSGVVGGMADACSKILGSNYSLGFGNKGYVNKLEEFSRQFWNSLYESGDPVLSATQAFENCANKIGLGDFNTKLGGKDVDEGDGAAFPMLYYYGIDYDVREAYEIKKIQESKIKMQKEKKYLPQDYSSGAFRQVESIGDDYIVFAKQSLDEWNTGEFNIVETTTGRIVYSHLIDQKRTLRVKNSTLSNKYKECLLDYARNYFERYYSYLGDFKNNVHYDFISPAENQFLIYCSYVDKRFDQVRYENCDIPNEVNDDVVCHKTFYIKTIENQNFAIQDFDKMAEYTSNKQAICECHPTIIRQCYSTMHDNF